MFSSYLNLAITLGPPVSNGYLLTVRGPGGDAHGALLLPTSERYQRLFADLQSFRSDEQAIIEIGQILFRAIFQGSIRDVYVRTQGMLAEGQGLRLTIDADASDGAVGALPWELLYDPDQGPLALLDTPVVRYLPQQSRIPSLKTDLPLKVLLTSAQTVAMTEAGQELEAVRQALAGLGAFVQIAVEPHLTVERLQRRLREGFHVWHFVGQSDFDTDGLTGRLVFEDDQDSIEYLTAPELAILLRGSDIRLVVLDAGQSARLATKPLRSIAPALIRARVSAVIAMQFATAEAITQAFAREFYQALVEGFPIDACVTEGRKAIMQISGLGGIDWGIPVVYSRASDGMLFDLPALPKPGCPYPGMVPFRAADAHFFCGRKAEIRQLLLHLRNQRRLFVIGPSGSGKSSLINAGLLPCLIASSLFPAGFWRLRSIRPGDLPMQALRQAIGDLSRPAQAIANLLAAHPPARRILLVVDQLEELFVQASRDDQRSFSQALRALEAIPEVTILCAMRADFYPDLMNSDLWPIDASQRVEIAPLRGERLREAIEQPAKDVGVRLEPGLVEQLLSDAADEPGVLPLIQETMVLLWDMMPRRLLPINIYTQLGSAGRSGLAVAIASKADATLEQLRPAEQTIARRIFLRLIQFGEGRADTRRQQPIAALRANTDDPAQFERTLRHLTDNRLLTLSGSAGAADRMVDIAHEALIGGWPRLQRWLAERRDAEQTRRRLEAKAAEWARLGRSNGGLLDEAELPEAERWLASDDAVDLGQNALLPALVHASRSAIGAAKKAQEQVRRREIAQAQALAAEQAQRAAAETRRAEEQAQSAKRLRRQALYLAGALLLALVGGVAAGIFGVAAQQNANEARGQTRIANARQLAAQSRLQLDEQFDLALLLSLEAYRTDSSIPAKDSLMAGLTYRPHLSAFLQGHTDEIHSVAFSPDGRIAASSGCASVEVSIGHRFCAKGELHFWDVATRKPLGATITETDSFVSSVAFSPDGKIVAWSSCGQLPGSNYCNSGQIHLWNMTTNQPISPPLSNGKTGVQIIRFSPDGTILAAGGCAESDGSFGGSEWCTGGEVRLWDVVTKRQIGQPIIAHQQSIYGLAFRPDGKVLATGSCGKESAFACDQGEIRLWDMPSGRSLGAPLITFGGTVSSLAFSPDGTTLASGNCGVEEKYPQCSQGELLLWNLKASEPVSTTLRGHMAGILSLAFSPDGKTMASGGADKTIFLWDTAALRSRGQLKGHTGDLTSVAFDPSGQILLSGDSDHHVILWDLATTQPLSHILSRQASKFQSVVFAPNNKILATGDTSGTITLWDVDTRGSLSPTFKSNRDIKSLAFSQDGKTLMVGLFSGAFKWDLTTNQQIGSAVISMGEAPAFSPDGRRLVFGTGDRFSGGIERWDLDTGQRIDAPIRTQEPASGTKAQDGHKSWVYSVTFSPDGKLIASGSNDATVILWDAATGRQLGPPLAGHNGSMWSLAFSPDGKELASGDDSLVHLWDMDTRQPIGIPLIGHHNSIIALAFSKDGKLLASGDWDGTIRLWDVASRQPLGLGLISHTDRVNSLALNGDGTLLASASDDGTLVLWDLHITSWQSLACQIANRNLSKAEWDQFIGSSTPYRRTCPDLPSGEGAPQTTP